MAQNLHYGARLLLYVLLLLWSKTCTLVQAFALVQQFSYGSLLLVQALAMVQDFYGLRHLLVQEFYGLRLLLVQDLAMVQDFYSLRPLLVQDFYGLRLLLVQDFYGLRLLLVQDLLYGPRPVLWYTTCIYKDQSPPPPGQRPTLVKPQHKRRTFKLSSKIGLLVILCKGTFRKPQISRPTILLSSISAFSHGPL